MLTHSPKSYLIHIPSLLTSSFPVVLFLPHLYEVFKLSRPPFLLQHLLASLPFLFSLSLKYNILRNECVSDSIQESWANSTPYLVSTRV